MQYTAQFFIDKFSAIPDELWCEDGNIHNRFGQHCAYGHCGYDGACSAEGAALSKLWSDHFGIGGFVDDMKGVAMTNDGKNLDYQQPTAKERILAALYDIKKANEKQQTKKDVDVGKEDKPKERIVYRSVEVDSKIEEFLSDIVHN